MFLLCLVVHKFMYFVLFYMSNYFGKLCTLVTV